VALFRIFQKMYRFVLCVALFWGLSRTAAAAPLPPYNLTECYELALSQSEELQIDRARIEAAEARYREALSAVYPQADVYLLEVLRDSASSTRGDTRVTPRRDRFESGVALSQILFTGFRELLIADATKAEATALGYERERRAEVLYGDVAALFFQMLLFEGDIVELEETARTLRARIGELKERAAIGKSRESEVLEARADLSSIEASIVQSRGLLNVSREMLAFLTGVSASGLTLEREVDEVQLGPVERYLEVPRIRPDLQAIAARIAGQESLVKARQRERWPTVSLDGTVYGPESPSSDEDWDLLFRLSVPVLDGGRISARVAEQKALLKALELRLAEQARTRERDIRRSFTAVSAGLAEVERLHTSVRDAEAALGAQRQDYELGVVSNLQVLDSIRQLREARRRLLATKFTLQRNHAELQVATGEVAR